jgi:hypothetical protein
MEPRPFRSVLVDTVLVARGSVKALATAASGRHPIRDDRVLHPHDRLTQPPGIPGEAGTSSFFALTTRTAISSAPKNRTAPQKNAT